MTKRAQLGMAMFLISEAVFFFLLLLAFVYFRAPESHLSLAAGSIATALLLVSSISMWRASKGSRVFLWVTIALGAAFLIVEANQYAHLIANSVTISQGLFGTTFFTLTGMHGLHVLVGLIALAILPSAGVRTMALYWYFLTVVWIPIFFLVYIWGAI